MRSLAPHARAAARPQPQRPRPLPPARQRAIACGRVRYRNKDASGLAPPADAQEAGSSAAAPAAQRTLVVAVDASAESCFALDWAVKELARPGDHFKLVHCVPALPPGRLVAVQGLGLLRVPHVEPALLAEQARAHADSSLSRELLATLEAAGVAGSFEVLHGPTDDSKASIGAALCRAATSHGAAAVVLGTASRGGLREALLGSVASSLVHSCEVPVVVLHKPGAAPAGAAGSGAAQRPGSSDVTLLMGATAADLLGHAAAGQLEPPGGAAGAGEGEGSQQEQRPLRTLVVAVDDSQEGHDAVAWVLNHLWRPGDELHLLHVVPAIPAHVSYSLAPDGMLYSLPLPQLEEAQVEESHWRQLLLERLGPLLHQRGVQFRIDVLTDFGSSDPLQGVAAAVAGAAEALNAAALVVCGHSKGGLAEWLLGSVSDWAVHHSSVPVVVLHGPGFAQE